MRKYIFNSVERGDGTHKFQNQVIKANKCDASEFGKNIQNSRKYRSYRIKKKRLCK